MVTQSTDQALPGTTRDLSCSHNSRTSRAPVMLPQFQNLSRPFPSNVLLPFFPLNKKHVPSNKYYRSFLGLFLSWKLNLLYFTQAVLTLNRSLLEGLPDVLHIFKNIRSCLFWRKKHLSFLPRPFPQQPTPLLRGHLLLSAETKGNI